MRKVISDVIKTDNPTEDDIAKLMAMCDANNDKALLNIAKVAFDDMSMRGKWLCVERMLWELKRSKDGE